MRHRLWLAATNVPALLLLGLTVVGPVGYVVVLSLNDVKAGFDITRRYVGLANYVELLGSGDFWFSLRQTLYFTLLSVLLTGTAGLGVALALARSGWRRALWLTLLIVPWAMPFVVNGLMWKWIFDPIYGALNGLLLQFGLIERYVAWLSTPWSAMHVVVIAHSWKLVPFVAITVFAQLQAIPGELYEAPAIDGASRGQIVRFIVLPLLRPALVTAMIFVTIWSLRAFDVIYVLTGGGPGDATSILNWTAYAQAFQYGDFGRASALGVLIGLVSLSSTLAYLRLAGREPGV